MPTYVVTKESLFPPGEYKQLFGLGLGQSELKQEGKLSHNIKEELLKLIVWKIYLTEVNFSDSVL